jgi:hypothetical protein
MRSGRSWGKKEERCNRDDPSDLGLGDCWDHVALDADSKFAIAVVADRRNLPSVRRLIGEMAQRTGHRLPRLITSDQYELYRTVLLEEYGVVEPVPPHPGRGKWSPRRRTPQGLVYAVVDKFRRKGRVIRVTVRRVYGTEEQLQQALGGSEVSGHVNISFIERYNATDRHLNARKARKVYRFSKDPGLHQAMTHFAQAVYNFCRPNRSLRIWSPETKWQDRTPAMALGLTQEVWSIEHLCLRQACPPPET